jgi:hypothetical protein
MDMIIIKVIRIPSDSLHISSLGSKGDQSKWLVGNKSVKQNTRGYERQVEVVAHSTLQKTDYVLYYPCQIILPDGEASVVCYSYDFRGKLQEVTLERLFEANFTSTDPILNDKSLSTSEKFEQIMQQVQSFTGLDVRNKIAQLLAFDALILNEDRHANNILFYTIRLKKHGSSHRFLITG